MYKLVIFLCDVCWEQINFKVMEKPITFSLNEVFTKQVICCVCKKEIDLGKEPCQN
jgi:hypothetical protein